MTIDTTTDGMMNTVMIGALTTPTAGTTTATVAMIIATGAVIGGMISGGGTEDSATKAPSTMSGQEAKGTTTTRTPRSFRVPVPLTHTPAT